MNTLHEYRVFWLDNPNHYCNEVIDPATCCPVAHGANKDYCTCKVSPEMVVAVEKFLHERYLETWRQYDREEHKWILRNHRTYWVNKTVPGVEPYLRVECRQKSGSCGIKEIGICPICNEKIDWKD